MKNARFIPLSVPNLGREEKILVDRCIETSWVSSAGAYVAEFERAICAYTGARYAVSCVNATMGLFLSLKLCGVEAGDEVIAPALTFIAPINAISYLGAQPVFMDCDGYLNLDPVKLERFLREECVRTAKGVKNRRSGRRIRAVLPVHVFGNPCQMDKIMRIARCYGLRVVEDAAEAMGSAYNRGTLKGKFAGTIGDAGVFSFNGNKIITTGAGGMIVTNSKKLAQQCKYLTTQAKDDPVRYIHNEIGYNFRLTNLSSAMGIAQLRKLERFKRIKKKNYLLYKSALSGVEGLSLLDTPEGTSPNYWFYSLIIDKHRFPLSRDRLMQVLARKNIETRPIWYLNHWQKPFRGCHAYGVERAVDFWRRVVNLPCSTDLSSDDVATVVDAIKRSRG